ncbi:DNA/RNA helicase domain-containing protein [Aminipila sp.]|uniref:DNA/RNA helicase domain-containing protein n=1 Tax=Aminipila sp. TaxID=2060095 RepID=UPI0028A14410|nr:DNA/RNA helicase domain-containing protein [Aminipila sp.]
MALIQSTDFEDEAPDKVSKLKYGKEWPVVYIINNKNEAYVGETVNANIRTSQHLKNTERRLLSYITLISDDNFNKSVILDLEAYLIKYMSSDGKFKLQNTNMGMQYHNYYNREEYESKFNEIWQHLKEVGLAKNEIKAIENSDIFKYSPYKELNLDQYRIIYKIIDSIKKYQIDGESFTTIVQGGAGSGKTVLAVFIMKLLSENRESLLKYSFGVDSNYEDIYESLKLLNTMKIGLVVPMQSLRCTIKKVFKNIKGLNINMVLSPIDVPKMEYDLLIVDEAHRLRQRKALSNYPTFDKNNTKLGFDNNGTELHWILKCSKNQVFFYDSMQSVKPSDVDKEQFDKLMENENITCYKLTSQFRCQGGNDYIDYVKSIFSYSPPSRFIDFSDYDFKIFDDVEQMIFEIKEREKKFGLCRTVAGYSWKWHTKKDNSQDTFDISIKGHQYKWNSESKDWVNSPNAINEIGCIHTIQGYDLNYAGVILGNEIKYDDKKQIIYVDKTQYHDTQGKSALKNKESLFNYIMNIYTTLMTRGIKGTYVYACDEKLNDYLSRYICKLIMK